MPSSAHFQEMAFAMTKFRPAEKNVVYVGEGVILEGKIHALDGVVVDGTVVGEITCDQLIVGESGVVNGHVAVFDADIYGKMGTHIAVKQRLVVRATGRVEGKWVYGEIEVEKGGILSGEGESTGFRSADRKSDISRKSDKDEKSPLAQLKKTEIAFEETSSAKGETQRVASVATRAHRDRNRFA
jgi:cytoskeletal protein CcmA (bactofilin family)